MNKLFKKIVLFYVAFSLVAMPIETLAAQKKVHKSASKSQKNTVAKSRVKTTIKSGKVQKVNFKPRASTKARTFTQSEYLAADRYDGSGILQLASAKALIINQNTGEVIYAKNTNAPTPIASITKLMTAMVMLDASLSLDETLTVTDEDVDYLKGSSSRLRVGSALTRSDMLQLASAKALIINQNTGEVIYAKNTNAPTPIASITKLMTAMVMLDANLSLDETLTVTDEDVDYLKGSSSRLSVGSALTRSDMLQLALMASENRAASAISRHYPGGKYAFFKAMNAKAVQLGMTNTEFMDATGLNSRNISTAEDLAKMVAAAYQYPEIRMASTSPSHEVYINHRTSPVNFNNTNGLVRGGEWQIGLSKTGYITEAGRCLVMQAELGGEPMIIVLLDSTGKLTRIGDANRVRKWVEYNAEPKMTTTGQIDLQPKSLQAKPTHNNVAMSGRIS